MRLRWRVSTGLALGLAALGAAAPVAGAQSASTGVAQTPESIRDYWTPERMREARPIEEALDDEGAILGGAEAGPAAKRGGAAAVPVRHRKRFPRRTHGKVFTTLGGVNYVCSGTVVRAPSRSLVITAGHCAYECGLYVLGECEDPNRATNFNFVPAFKNGDKPFGEWPAQAGGVRATPQYENNENLAYDVGAAVIAPRNGREIQEVLGGGRGIAFNESTNHVYRAFGYPALAPFNGQVPYLCRSGSSGRDNSYNPATIRISCDQTGGASGGGWVIDGGRIASLTSYGYDSQPGKLYGPYFGSAISNFYDLVKND
jgi:V8-like Glu-specific endopeptidase